MGSIDNITLPSDAHILAFPFPAKGHINPLLHLCNRLTAKGFRITLITTTATFKSVQSKASGNGINIECIEDELEHQDAEGDMDDYFRKFRAAASKGLKDLIEKFKKNGYSLPKVVIYDSTMPWILDVVHPMGVKGASFFTQCCSVCTVYYHMGDGTIKVPFEKDIITRLPSMPPLEFDDLPGLQYFPDPNGTITRLLTDQFSNIDKADYILFNTFEKLEVELATWMAKRWPIKTVGPTSPLTFAHEKLKNTTTNDHQENYLFETNTETCLKWLDQREPSSVVYVSFGSIAAPVKEQIEEVAEALLKIKCRFLWVVRSEEESKLPTSFKDDTSDQGLIINWCPQLDVLGHQAVACFVTHCGWNSTIEALSSGVPMIAVPQWVDQTTNAKFIADVWKVGIRVKVNEKGIVTRDEFERCIRDITEGYNGKEIRRNATKWKELAIEAVSEGGSSERNIEDFAASLLS
ncbi:OLC1v1008027C1 [Oldenlandia corymbosa var. corymbosa]|uniref:Glycosyltransferase n=1 Tax=Oldenlandia corymbosa var. corymbosa TaxID=529605 RepID=A0AAV1DNV3_OLDCO|nr:OLC1v1008027C1 [Oldenlandia corymbosa var. corymbosa]